MSWALACTISPICFTSVAIKTFPCSQTNLGRSPTPSGRVSQDSSGSIRPSAALRKQGDSQSRSRVMPGSEHPAGPASVHETKPRCYVRCRRNVLFLREKPGFCNPLPALQVRPFRGARPCPSGPRTPGSSPGFHLTFASNSVTKTDARKDRDQVVTDASSSTTREETPGRLKSADREARGDSQR